MSRNSRNRVEQSWEDWDQPEPQPGGWGQTPAARETAGWDSPAPSSPSSRQEAAGWESYLDDRWEPAGWEQPRPPQKSAGLLETLAGLLPRQSPRPDSRPKPAARPATPPRRAEPAPSRPAQAPRAAKPAQPISDRQPQGTVPPSPPRSPQLAAICQAAEELRSPVRLTGVSEEQLRRLMHQVSCLPDYFWLDSHYSYHIHADSAELSLQWRYTDIPRRRRQLEQAAAEILAGMPRGDGYQQAVYLHDWLCSHLTYQKWGEGTGQDIYEALCLRRCVCAGYAKAYAYLLRRAGVACAVVRGIADGEKHAWNRVVLGGQIYYTDVTWDSRSKARRCYEWFNLTSAQMLKTHTPTYSADMPPSGATAYNFYRRGGLLLSRWDEGELVEILARQPGKTMMVGFDRQQVYQALRERMGQRDFSRLLRRAGHPCSSWSWYHTRDGWGLTLVAEE